MGYYTVCSLVASMVIILPPQPLIPNPYALGCMLCLTASGEARLLHAAGKSRAWSSHPRRVGREDGVSLANRLLVESLGVLSLSHW